MASLKVTFESGAVETYKITPAIEVEFEAYAKMGITKCFRETEMQTHLYYLVWVAIKHSGQTVALWGPEFLKTLASVDIEETDPSNG
jgi:hypothetical protein